jgi:Uri superfamily endonuclease
MPENPITYQLTIRLKEDARIAIGKFGTCFFPAGDYVYTGSARRNLEARIARHCSKDKKLRWHIDYLLSAPETRIIHIARFTQAECTINRQQAGRILIKGLGASDCHAGCGSHLKYLGKTDTHD